MKKSLSHLLTGVMLLTSFNLATTQSALPERYEKWLEEEVVYIINPVEREVFLKLSTDRERDLFIEAFWRQRDPTPASEENEFKTEHYRRINYVNHFFGRGTPKPGWRTDRGRIYIILGEPNDIQRYDGETMIYPTEVWFYQGKTDLGLPAGFHLVFFRGGGIGDYELYSPAKDGPQALLTSYYGDPIDYLSAYKMLKEIKPTLADVSLSLIPGEERAVIGRPSMASDLLIQRVEGTAQRLVEERYARKFLEYKDIVEVEYTANYIDNESLITIIKEPSGIYFVHFCLQPERLSVGQHEKKYYTTLKVNGNVSTPDGKMIDQFDRTISLEFDQEQMAGISRQPLNIYDLFPLIPGTYRLSLIVKNEVSKEFTSLESTLSIPSDEAILQMTSLLLGYKSARTEDQRRLKPFRIGPYQIYVQPSRVFSKKDTLSVAFQVHGIKPEWRERAEFRYVFSQDEKEFLSLSRKISDYPNWPNFLEEFTLAGFPPAHYNLRISLMADSQEFLAGANEFDVTHLEAVSRPWVHTKVFLPYDDLVYDYLVGGQLFRNGKTDEALVRLEKAHSGNPASEDFALGLARVYADRHEYGKIESLLYPFFEREETPRYEIFFLMGKACQNTGQLEKAIDIYDQAVSHYGANINLFNSLGECYFELGDSKAALVIWQKSLELNPDQPEVKKIVDSLRGMK